MRYVCLFLLVTLLAPAPAMAQRFGDGRILRRILGLEDANPAEEAAPDKSDVFSPRQLEPLPSDRAQHPYPTPAQQGSRARSQSPALYPWQYRPPTAQSPIPAPTRRLQPIPAGPPSTGYPRSANPLTNSFRPFRGDPEPTPAEHPTLAEQPTLAERPVPAGTSWPGNSDHSELTTKKSNGVEENDEFGLTLKLVGKQVVISSVYPSGPAAAAGLEAGDVLASVASIPVQSPDDIGQLSGVLKPGDQIEVEYVRRGKENKALVPYVRQATTSNDLPDESDRDPADFLNSPPTGNPSTPLLTAADSAPQAEVAELRRIVQRQQQVIERLESRLQQLEPRDRSRLMLRSP